jgi:Recombinase
MIRVRLYGMSRRRQQRRVDKTRRHLQSAHQPRSLRESPAAAPPRVVVREASHVGRLAYTRSQAAQALGISLSTLRRLLPYIETIELPWGTSLIPVDELERLAVERRRTARPRLEPATRGRKPAISPEIRERIHHERTTGKSLRDIAADLNADRIPSAHGGACWWPSTIRQVLQRASA